MGPQAMPRWLVPGPHPAARLRQAGGVVVKRPSVSIPGRGALEKSLHLSKPVFSYKIRTLIPPHRILGEFNKIIFKICYTV